MIDELIEIEIFINIVVGSLEISIGLANKKLGTVRNRICQAFLFNLQLINHVSTPLPDSTAFMKKCKHPTK